MNREILFRGIRVDNGEWVYGSLLSFADGRKTILPSAAKVFKQNGTTTICCNECHDVDPATVGQYTGLTDKNGERIFEGDILRGDIPSCLVKDQNNVGFVRYEKTAFVVDFSNSREAWETQKVGFCSFWNYEVIGNIHDNPSLLEGA